MKDSEKRNILILLVVSVIIIVGINIFVKVNTKPQNEQTNTGTTEENTPSDNQKNETQKEEEIDEYTQVLADGSKLNISDNLAKGKTFEGLEITNIQLKAEGKTTRLLADVENKTGARTKDRMIKIDFLDKDGKVITTMRGFINPMEVGGTSKINISVSADVSNTYDIKISNV